MSNATLILPPILNAQTPYPPGITNVAQRIRQSSLPFGGDLAMSLENIQDILNMLNRRLRQSQVASVEIVAEAFTVGVRTEYGQVFY